MGPVRTFVAALSAILLAGTTMAAAQDEQRPVVVFDYAVDHPVEDADLRGAPSIGASVPQTVQLATVEGAGDNVYGYFYWQGRPVIVELSTRAVVRIGN